MELLYLGHEDEAATNPIVFQNKKPLSYAKDVLCELKNKNIDARIIDKFQKLNIKISFPKEQAIAPSALLFASKATTNDGLYRFCRLCFKADYIILEECRGSRTPPYSSLYPILLSRLKKRGLSLSKKPFCITIDFLETFVDCVNEVNAEVENDYFDLVIDKKKHSLAFSGKKYYYNIAYWAEKKEEATSLMHMQINEFNKIFSLITESTTQEFISRQVEIDRFFAKINDLSVLYKARKEFSAESQRIKRECNF